jgi:multiple antibiotic resistance protein
MLEALKLIPMVAVALFPVLNPIGSAIIIFGMTGNVDNPRWKSVSKKIAIYGFLMLTFFFLFGSYILKMFGITVPIVQLSGGLVLASIGWKTLNQKDEESAPDTGSLDQVQSSLEAKTFYPYTFPITVGPGCIAVVLTFSAHLNRANHLELPFEKLAIIVGIFLMFILTYLCYANLKVVVRRVSASGSLALSKIMAFFVLCIGVDIAWSGYQALSMLMPK